MGRIIAIVNQKGGVGKTTTAVNLTASLTEAGKRVLLCDFDPQANATSGLGVDKRRLQRSVYDVIINDEPVEQAIVHTDYGDVLPSTADLAGAGVELITMDSPNYRLRTALQKVQSQYDYIFIDCPPSLGLLTLNALVASDSVVIPIQSEFFALEGLSQLMNTIKIVKMRLNAKLNINGVVLTMYDTRTTMSKQVTAEIYKYFGEKMYTIPIPRNVRLVESPSFGVPVFLHSPNSNGATAYAALAEQFLQREE